jgi:hypothetical protein
MSNWKSIFWGLLLLILPATSVLAQAPQHEGIILKETRVKSNIYQIRVVGLGGPISAHQLDETIGSRQGVLSCQTDPQTSICTVEALKTFDKKWFEQLLEIHGLKIAKTFEQ